MTAAVTALPRRRPVGQRASLPVAPVLRRGRRGGGAALFAVAASAYLTVALFLLDRRVIFPDGASRVANAFFVLYSRDPHLPAVGFVWNPLPSLLVVPLLPLRAAFPALLRDGFAGSVESALCMAGAVVVLSSCLARLGVRRWQRLTLTLLFAVHPMTVLYAGSGESEAMLLLFVLLAVRSLLGWLADRSPGQLVATGIALGLAYFTRYEAVAPAVAVTLVVGGLTLRGAGRGAHRVRLAVNDMALVGLPFAFAFVLWSVASRVLVGAWFPTFTSESGNAAQVGLARGFIERSTGGSTAAALHYLADQLVGLAPAVGPLLLLALVVGVRRRQLAALAAPLALGAVLLFNELAFLTGHSFGWLRFEIAVVPLTVLVAGGLLAGLPSRPGRHRLLRGTAVGLVLASVAAALPVAMGTLADHRLAREETVTALAALSPSRATAADRRHLLVFQTEQQIAADIDAMRLPDGAVLTDSANAYPVLVASARPHVFAITSDRDFPTLLRDPAGHGVRYLLVPDPRWATVDAVDRAWPGTYAGTGAIATVVRTWHGTSFNGNWELLAVTDR